MNTTFQNTQRIRFAMLATLVLLLLASLGGCKNAAQESPPDFHSSSSYDRTWWDTASP